MISEFERVKTVPAIVPGVFNTYRSYLEVTTSLKTMQTHTLYSSLEYTLKSSQLAVVPQILW